MYTQKQRNMYTHIYIYTIIYEKGMHMLQQVYKVRGQFIEVGSHSATMEASEAP